jgi:hypothetical protein
MGPPPLDRVSTPTHPTHPPSKRTQHAPRQTPTPSASRTSGPEGRPPPPRISAAAGAAAGRRGAGGRGGDAGQRQDGVHDADRGGVGVGKGGGVLPNQKGRGAAVVLMQSGSVSSSNQPSRERPPAAAPRPPPQVYCYGPSDDIVPTLARCLQRVSSLIGQHDCNRLQPLVTWSSHTTNRCRLLIINASQFQNIAGRRPAPQLG